MKNMNFPLDIIWISENMKIVDISADIAPETYPQSFSSKTPASYVLEINAGLTDKYSLKIGDIVKLKP
jgi:hypothetical protein